MNGRKNTYCKLIDVEDCKTSKTGLLAVEFLSLIMYNYPTAKTRTLDKSTHDNPPNSDGLGDLHRTVPKLIVLVY
jgi:hypothetical protein